jgi:protein-S-isoprenylcysteine O-methyltransferase Ste14
VLIDAFRRFATEGHGTPAPVAPPTTLVVRGAYRHVRNPMYVAVLMMVVVRRCCSDDSSFSGTRPFSG